MRRIAPVPESSTNVSIDDSSTCAQASSSCDEKGAVSSGAQQMRQRPHSGAGRLWWQGFHGMPSALIPCTAAHLGTHLLIGGDAAAAPALRLLLLLLALRTCGGGRWCGAPLLVITTLARRM